jgi:hypothetical protein
VYDLECLFFLYGDAIIYRYSMQVCPHMPILGFGYGLFIQYAVPEAIMHFVASLFNFIFSARCLMKHFPCAAGIGPVCIRAALLGQFVEECSISSAAFHGDIFYAAFSALHFYLYKLCFLCLRPLCANACTCRCCTLAFASTGLSLC